MWKSCSRCGRIHSENSVCPKPTYYRYGNNSVAERKFRGSTEWQSKREEIKKESNYLCTACKYEGRLNYNSLEVHHIEKLKDRFDLSLDNDNLIVLCTAHHKLADEGKIDKEYLKKLVREREGNTPPSGG